MAVLGAGEVVVGLEGVVGSGGFVAEGA